MTDSLERRQTVGRGRSLLTAVEPGSLGDTGALAPVVQIPGSEEEAVALYGDGTGVTVVGGATTVAPQLSRGSLHSARVLLLHEAGLASATDDGTNVSFGATATLQSVADAAPDPLATAATIPDREIRAQGTIAGNLHWPGDLHAPLIALRAEVRSAGSGGERTEPVERYVHSDEPRLVLGVSCRRPLAGAFLSQRRIHSTTLTVMSVAVARFADGVVVAVGGTTSHGIRCPSVEAALAGGAAPADAAAAVAADIAPENDPLASGWYRARVMPVLITRTLTLLEDRS